MKTWLPITGLLAICASALFGLRFKRQRGHREWNSYTDRV